MADIFAEESIAMRKFSFLFLFNIIALCSFSQKNGVVRGIAFDTISKQPVAGATVTLLVKKDSSLISFTMTGKDGKFELRSVPNGEYRLMITHVNYYIINRQIIISDSNKIADAGNMVMNDRTKVLEEVVIAAEAPPVTLINDTIQYNAGFFKVQPNGSVEQLLKKLPGIKVEKDGSIKAQGEKVSRVLVDGKEFFGNDPKIATKNLPADAVDKVQVYDKQSDQSQLTGFEDGNYEKTINLKLKKDKKKGLFGKVTAGAGNKDRFENKFNLNSFKGARQLSAIGMGNNTNAEGFSFMDILNFTGELARMQRNAGGGGMNISITDNDMNALGINGSNNGGINTAWGGGLNYNNIIGNKLDWQSNYFYNRLNPKQENHIQRQYLLPDSTYFYDQNSFSNNLNNNHRLNINSLWQVDSMNSIRINPSFSYQQTDNSSQTDYTTLSEEKTLTNKGFSNTTSSNNGYNFRADLIWRKKFARKGRTFSLSLQSSLNNSDGKGSLYSINEFFRTNGSTLRKDTLNQNSRLTADLTSYNVKAVYTEPIWKKSLLEFSVTKSDSKNTSEKMTYDYNRGNGKFDQLNSSLTNTYENVYGFTNAGIRLRTQKKKFNYALGLSWQEAQMKGKIITGQHDSLISKAFHNFLPNARFQYNFSRFRTLSFNYSSSTNQPTAQQLQPVPDNSNALNIREGNPQLKQEFIQSIMSNLNLMNPFKNRNLFMYLAGQFTGNKIVNYDSVDQFGIKRTRPVNVNGVYNINTNISYSLPLKFIKSTIELSSNARMFKTKQFIQGQGNNIRTFSLGPDLRLDINPNDKLNFGIEYELNYNKTSYSLQTGLNNSYISQDYGVSADIQLPKQFFLSTEFNYTVNSQRASGFNLKVPLWNASLSKQFLKYNRGELKLSARDLLNRNVGISRNTNNNYIEDSRMLTLRQFFLLSFTYSLSKTGLNNAGGGGNMRVITR
jgi:hypothetical protein